MGSFLKSVMAAACVLTVSAFSDAGARADKLADILSKGVVRIGVPLDAPPFGSPHPPHLSYPPQSSTARSVD